MPEAPKPIQLPAKKNQPAYVGGIVPQISDITPIANKPMKETLIFRFTFRTLENNREDAIIPTAKDSSTALPYIADSLK